MDHGFGLGNEPQYTAMRWGYQWVPGLQGLNPGTLSLNVYIWDSIDQLVADFSTSLAFFHVHSLFKKYWGIDDPTWLSYMFWWFNHCCSHSLVKKNPPWRAGSCRRRSTRPPVVAVGGFYGGSMENIQLLLAITSFTQRFFYYGDQDSGFKQWIMDWWWWYNGFGFVLKMDDLLRANCTANGENDHRPGNHSDCASNFLKRPVDLKGEVTGVSSVFFVTGQQGRHVFVVSIVEIKVQSFLMPSDSWLR